MTWLLATVGPRWLYHPLGVCVGTHAQVIRCKSYNFYSGVGSDLQELVLPITVIVGLLTVWLAIRRFLHAHFECHEESCHRYGFHHVEGTPHRTCWEHHPVLSEHEHHGVPGVHIRTRHFDAKARK